MKVNDELVRYAKDNHLAYHIVTYGCQMNEHESEKLGGILQSSGFLKSGSSEDADLILFNTCCIRDNAEQKTFGNVGALKKLKEEKPHLLIGVCGCMTQQEKVAKKLYDTFPFVDIIFGTHNMEVFPEMLADRILNKKRTLDVCDSDGSIYEDIPIMRGEGPLASVNIMYGCNNFCSYCIVPYVRGRERSRKHSVILAEIDELVAEGYKEIMLLGQNVNSYHDGDTSFPKLLQMICNQTEIERIRFMTSHPKDLSDELVAVMQANQQLCKHIHLPVQSGSSRILQLMNRGYNREQYLRLIQLLQEAMPDIAITTDFIVGFPGETDMDFADTLSLAEMVRFDSAFTFVYSERSGTAAADMEDSVPQAVRRARIMELIALQNAITEDMNGRYVGRTVTVLVEGSSSRDAQHVCGRTDTGKMVNFAGPKELIGTFQQISITEAKRTTLFGQLI